MVCFYACMAVAIWLTVSPRAFSCLGLQSQRASLGAQPCFGSVGRDICKGPIGQWSPREEKSERGASAYFLAAYCRVDAFCSIAQERFGLHLICCYCIRKEGLRQERTAVLLWFRLKAL